MAEPTERPPMFPLDADDPYEWGEAWHKYALSIEALLQRAVDATMAITEYNKSPNRPNHWTDVVFKAEQFLSAAAEVGIRPKGE